MLTLTSRRLVLTLTSALSLGFGCAASGDLDENVLALGPAEEATSESSSAATSANDGKIVSVERTVESLGDAGGEEVCPMWFRDCDADGFAASDEGAVQACTKPEGVADCAAFTDRAPEEGAVDCNDASAAHHPGAGFALSMPAGSPGLQNLLCRAGTFAGDATRSCVTTDDADLNCDGRLEPDPKGGPFCFAGGHCIATVDHACAGPEDCGCWNGPLACGSSDATVVLCAAGTNAPPRAFTGAVALPCR